MTDQLASLNFCCNYELNSTTKINWENACLTSYDGREFCRLGLPFPEDLTGVDADAGDENGLKFNCYVNHKIDDYWVPKLENELKKHVPEIAARISAGTTPQ